MNKTNLNSKKILILSGVTFCLLFSFFINISIATTARYAINYVDGTPDNARKVNDNTYGDMKNLASLFNMGEGTVICTGISYLYYNYGPGTGPYDVDIRFEGDSYWVGYSDFAIPDAGGGISWRTFRCLGPTYLLDDDPWVRFIGTDPSDNCIAICLDGDSSPSNSYYDNGGGWTLETSGEYMTELIYEWVTSLNPSTTATGSITTTDFVDAYFISLTGGVEYEFELDRTSGSGNLDMRLVVNQDLTNNILVQSSGSSDPEYMRYTPSTMGTYVLLVEPNTPVTDTADYSVQYYIEPKPIADFSANSTTIFENETIQFTFTGSEGDTPATYLWDFGDSSLTSTTTNPTHKYNMTGSYTVSLTVTDKDGDPDAEIKTDYIIVETDISPTANFSNDQSNIIEGDTIQFTFTGTEGNAPATYLWDFGDGGTSIAQNPTHQYLIPGSFSVNLTVTDRNGDSDNKTKQDLIIVAPNQKPEANFTVNSTNIFEGEWIEFTFTGDEGDTPATYLWDFGDGGTSIAQNPIYQYNTSGIYSVDLNVTDVNGDSDNKTMINLIAVIADLAPTANFSANITTIVIGESVQFTFTGSEGDSPATFEWDFGDGGQNSTKRNPIHIYNTLGTYSISLLVIDSDGDIDSITILDYILVEDEQISIIINNPEMNAVYHQNAPAYSLIVIGSEIELMWYTLNNESIEYYFTVITGIINQTAWDALSEGHVRIRFHVQDINQKSCYKDIIIVKDLSSDDLTTSGSTGIPGYDAVIVFSLISIITLTITLGKRKSVKILIK